MMLQQAQLWPRIQTTGIRPRPFLKWAGGKRQLLPELMARLPECFAAYHEPHVGSGVLFFELAARGGLPQAYLSDVNPSLIDTYVAVRDQVEDVIATLKKHQRKHDQDYYYLVRAIDPSRLPLAGRAARIIYLNKTCYNGLYRENKSGQFNVPFGRYKNPTICDAVNLREVSRALHGADIARRGYASVLERAQPGDFVYFDPPYHPLSATSSFTAYDRNGFTADDQRGLRDIFGDLARRGVYVMLSNSDTPLIRELYAGFKIERVYASRSINSKGNRRGKITELIIRNY
ncbi:MAG TPA: DNA adenine methylase [Anaerolineae bacterium]|nr:DNA adenine methylase [Anaerolineae bacterium]